MIHFSFHKSPITFKFESVNLFVVSMAFVFFFCEKKEEEEEEMERLHQRNPRKQIEQKIRKSTVEMENYRKNISVKLTQIFATLSGQSQQSLSTLHCTLSTFKNFFTTTIVHNENG